MQNQLNYFYQFLRVEVRDRLHVGTLGLDDSHHGSVEDGGQLHEGVLEEQGVIRVLPNFFLNIFDIVLKYNPAPSDIRNDIDRCQM